MQSQDEFVAARSRDWNELDKLLLQPKEMRAWRGAEISRLASLYRSLCNDLMRCRSTRYAPDLTGYLNGLAGRAHNRIYDTRPFRVPALLRLVTHEFPQSLRKNANFFALSALLFLMPCAVGLFGSLYSADFAAAVLPQATLDGMADAYSEGFTGGRDTGTNTGMAGFYVYNNVGIAFRCFATGILFGAGSLFFLIYNGLIIGTVAGYVMDAGHGGNILTFMCGHAPFELTAIVIAGAAGLQMGYSLVDTRGLTRLGSLRREAPALGRIIIGAALMLMVAALVEGFWSPSSAPASVKWAMAGIFTLAVGLYLALAGRDGARS
jgi:uncharacterized membrane protein SpoIIM required for sporulation